MHISEKESDSMVSSYYQHLLELDRQMRAKLGTHITCDIGKEAEARANAERKAKHELSMKLGEAVRINEKGQPNDLPLLETFCKNVYDAPLDQELQSPTPLTDRIFEIREIVSAADYPIESRNRIIEIFGDLLRHARLDNCARNQVAIAINSFQTANQRAASRG